MARYKNNLKLDLVTIPNPLLRKKSKDLKISEIKNDSFKELIKEMSILMEEYKGVGLSAIQVGIPKNFFIIKKDFDKEDEQNPFENIEVYINPKITEQSQEKVESWEGCLSIPGIECLVERTKKIKVTYINMEGNIVQEEIEDFRSIVFQHEYDHTKGILIIDKAKEIKNIVQH
ncbi:MAG: peptide deformylase [bacterium]